MLIHCRSLFLRFSKLLEDSDWKQYNSQYYNLYCGLFIESSGKILCMLMSCLEVQHNAWSHNICVHFTIS